MSTRTVLYVLAVAVTMLTLPAAASAMPIYDTGPVATPPAAHGGPSALLFVAAGLAVVLVIATVRVVHARPAAVKA
jgi:hypothetical protein